MLNPHSYVSNGDFVHNSVYVQDTAIFTIAPVRGVT